MGNIDQHIGREVEKDPSGGPDIHWKLKLLLWYAAKILKPSGFWLLNSEKPEGYVRGIVICFTEDCGEKMGEAIKDVKLD